MRLAGTGAGGLGKLREEALEFYFELRVDKLPTAGGPNLAQHLF